jgi:hypothetical protein
MAAGALLIVGLMMAALSTMVKSTRDALEGRSLPEASAPKIPTATSPSKTSGRSDVIHVEEGDPLPAATPLPRPNSDATSAQAQVSHKNPNDMSRAELIDEVTELRVRVTSLETQMASIRTALSSPKQNQDEDK